ncbi:MAG: hypothetical protein NDJ18_04435, partial [candidate division Zixibacteria bacterium]|nr:hypothetical protein [candidate division Zixibacteria bacterium]
MSFKRLFPAIAALILFAISVTPALAVAPTAEAIEKWKNEGILDAKMAQLQAFKDAGGCSPIIYSQSVKDLYRTRFATDANAVETIKVVVILVDFSDWTYADQARAATRNDFDSILFTDRRSDTIVNPTGSMTDYYLEASYGKVFIRGEVFGWYRMPSTYAYYVGTTDGLTMGPVLAKDAVDIANADIEYDKFDNPGIGVPVVIVHAGPGAETGAYGIWSHKSTIFNTPVHDGV